MGILNFANFLSVCGFVKNEFVCIIEKLLFVHSIENVCVDVSEYEEGRNKYILWYFFRIYKV